MKPSDSTLHRALVMTAAALVAGAALLVHRVATGSMPEHWRLAMLLAVMFMGLAGGPPRTQVKCQRTRIQIAVLEALALALLTTVAVALASHWIAGSAAPAASIIIVAVATTAAGLLGNVAVPAMQRRLSAPKVVLIHGANELGVDVAQRLASEPYNVKVGGFLHDGTGTNIPLPHPIVGSLEDLPERLPNGEAIDGVVLALPTASPDEIDSIRRKLRAKALTVFVAAPIGIGGTHFAQAHIGPIPCYVVGTRNFGRTEQKLKRVLDILVASVALAIFAPVLLLCAIAIKLESRGPVIYRQRRFTTANRLFDCYKLRTMFMDRPAENGIVLTQRNDRRVTRVGAFLRRTSLDEVPQFINVLQGHMSVVGPRPHPPGVKAGERTYEDVITDFGDRYAVKPGITGWAQVSGLRGNTFNEGQLIRRFEHDIEYIHNWSLSFEILIILKTVFGGFGGKNAF